jgi:hypothetical protein
MSVMARRWRQAYGSVSRRAWPPRGVAHDEHNLITMNSLYGLFITNVSRVQTFSLNGNSLTGNTKGDSKNAGTGTIVP